MTHLVEQRKLAGMLIQQVLEEQTSASYALTRWPEYTEDPSLDSAYQALWYFEADEDRHQVELFYLDVQLQLLQQIGAFLKQGQPLPQYLLQQYPPEFKIRYYQPTGPVASCLADLKRMWRTFKKTLEDALQLFWLTYRQKSL